MSTKDFSNKQEKMIASYLGWRVVSGSGSRAGHPGDIIDEDGQWLGECKTHETSGKNIFFSYSVWKKIQHEAASQHRRPVLFTDDGSQREDRTWCIVPNFTISCDESVSMFLKRNSTNINFKHENLVSIYKESRQELGDSFVFITSLGDQKVALISLEHFYEMFIK